MSLNHASFKLATLALLSACLSWTSLGLRTASAQEKSALQDVESPFQDDTRTAEPIPQGRSDIQRGVHCPTPEELDNWFKPLNRIQLSSRAVDGPMPIDCSKNLFYRPNETGMSPTRNWAMTEFHWQASNLCAQPAYWDDVPLERYGQTIHPAVQPGISGAKFFCTFPIIPYKIGIDRTHDLIYTLGYYRPGSPTPKVRQRLPWEMDAAAFEAGAWIGLIVLLP